jgi:regulatory protein
MVTAILPELIDFFTKKGAKPLLTRPTPLQSFSIPSDYGTNGAVSSSTSYQRQPRRPPTPLDRAALERLALAYVSRYATTRKKLSDYLTRKIRTSGWAGDGAPPVDAIVARMAELRYIDDEAFARMRAEGLTRRGYGPQRVTLALRHAGITDEDASAAKTQSNADAEAAAYAFARRRKLGPFAISSANDPAADRKAIAAMCRAGHSYEIARKILSAPVDFVQDEDVFKR